MAIDIKDKEALKKLTLDNLIDDAVERGDIKALDWLEREANTTKTRKRADGTEYEAKKSIVEIRPEYLKKFLNYKKTSKSSEESKKRKKEEQQKKLDDKFAKARAKLQKK